MRVEVDSTIIDPAKDRIHATIKSGDEQFMLSLRFRDALAMAHAIIQAVDEGTRPCEARKLKRKG